jgi:hypothetical protein
MDNGYSRTSQVARGGQRPRPRSPDAVARQNQGSEAGQVRGDRQCLGPGIADVVDLEVEDGEVAEQR